MLFLEFTSKNSLLSMPVSLNQEHGEIGTFYNRPTSQITEMAVSLFNILVNFTKYYLDNIIKHYLYYLDSKYNFFLTLQINFHLVTLYTYGTFCILLYVSEKFFDKFFRKVWLTYVMWRYWIEPSPRPDSGQSFSICHWNLSSIAAHNWSKISLWRAYNAIHNHDVCLSETHLNHDALSDNDNLKIPCYELIRFDHPAIQKRGGTCLYHKDFLPIKVNNISCLKELLNFSLSLYGEQSYITLI